MKLDWDETKRQTTLRTRGLDFADVDQIEWDKAIVIDDGRRDYGERRQEAGRMMVGAEVDTATAANRFGGQHPLGYGY